MAVTPVLQLGSIMAMIADFRKDVRQGPVQHENLEISEARLGLACDGHGVHPSGWPHVRLFFHGAYAMGPRGGVQGGFAVEKGCQPTLANPPALLKPLTAVDNGLPQPQ